MSGLVSTNEGGRQGELTAQIHQVSQQCPGLLAAKSGNWRSCPQLVPENLMKSPAPTLLPVPLH